MKTSNFYEKITILIFSILLISLFIHFYLFGPFGAYPIYCSEIENLQQVPLTTSREGNPVTSEQIQQMFASTFKKASYNLQNFFIQSPLEPGDKNPSFSWMEYLLGFKVDFDTQGAFTNYLYQYKGLLYLVMYSYAEVFISLVILLVLAAMYAIFSTYYTNGKLEAKVGILTKILLFTKGKLFNFSVVSNLLTIFFSFYLLFFVILCY